MHSFINFIMGPMVWISFLTFSMGLVYKFYQVIKLVNEKEKFIYTYLSFKYSFRSIFAWLLPFLPVSTRKSPIFYSISYLFHLLLFLIPLFLLSHVALFEESIQWSWMTLDDSVSDILTLIIIFSLIFFMIRRIIVPEVRFLTRLSDFIFILIVLLPFATGFLSYHQFFAYKWMVIVHVLSGELMLVLIPFTRFAHMLMAPLTRAYAGSEFGNVRHAKDW